MRPENPSLPPDQYPDGQWDYYRYYTTHFEAAVTDVNGDWDGICSITGNRLGDPMRAACADLAVTSVPAGHWLPLERKAEHIQAIRTWLQSKEL